MRFNRLDLNLLVALDALLAERSVTRAAARLNLSPSATSDALARLRAYFDDELLVQVGRRMEPTPRAEGLGVAVRDMLVRVDATITTPPQFDPATTDRCFRIFASDYTQMVLMPHVMRRLAAARCTARFEILPQVADPQRDLERGEADLLILPTALLSPSHPQQTLYTEDFVCAIWADSPLARQPLTVEAYLAADHVVMRPQSTTSDSYEDWFVKRAGVRRRVVATSYGFATVPALLIGTPFVATMHRRLASLLAAVWPLALRPCPLDVPAMQQGAQWHRYRTHDPGLRWLLTQLQAGADGLPP
jgi:DNA-binding transcriptional LysR family regulator